MVMLRCAGPHNPLAVKVIVSVPTPKPVYVTVASSVVPKDGTRVLPKEDGKDQIDAFATATLSAALPLTASDDADDDTEALAPVWRVTTATASGPGPHALAGSVLTVSIHSVSREQLTTRRPPEAIRTGPAAAILRLPVIKRRSPMFYPSDKSGCLVNVVGTRKNRQVNCRPVSIDHMHCWEKVCGVTLKNNSSAFW